jgi:3-methylcrotonyl-CoA carboxylase beta subunit
MGGEQAAKVLSTVKQSSSKQAMTSAEIIDFERPILEKYEKEGSPYYASARIWDDGVIDPTLTRDILGLALSATLNKEIPEANFGVFRM